jgi:hypothetical protein
MADDVKVKFGGDFTDVPKGAEAAATAAGTSLSGWVGKYSDKLKEKLTHAFSMENVVGKFVSMIGEQLEKFKEIDTLSRKLGVSREELQKFAKIGKEFNVDMETMGRSIAYANKTLGAAATGNKEAKAKLTELGFTQDEVNSKHIKSTEILFKLAEQYEKNKKLHGDVAAGNILSRETTNLFGRAGADLVSVLKEGNTELKNRIDLMSVYSESEVKAGAAAARAAERAQERFKRQVVGRVIGGGAGIATDYETFGIFGEGGLMGEALKKSGFKGREDVKTLADAEKLSENLAKLAKKEGIEPEDLVNAIEAHKATSYMSDHSEEVLNNMQMHLGTMAHNAEVEERNANTSRSETPSNITALAASSLQQIGGGDISSVLAGSTTNNIEENTLRTAVAVEQIANNNATTEPPTSVAK